MHSIVRRALVILLVSAATLGAAVPISTAASRQNAAPAKNTYGAAALYGVGGGKVSGSAAIMGIKGGLRVVVSVSGLVPMSTHAEHIHAGVCGNNGPIKLPLADLVADAHGRATSVTMIKAKSVPGMGWSINVHDSKTFAPISCGNVYQLDMIVPLQPTGTAKVSGLGLILGNMDTHGGMSSKDKGAVVVTVVMGLQANTSHAEHLHTGKCGSNGAVKIPLTTLMANAQGYAVAATFITRMASLTGLYLNVHATDGSPVACGTLTGMMPM